MRSNTDDIVLISYFDENGTFPKIMESIIFNYNFKIGVKVESSTLKSHKFKIQSSSSVKD